MANLGGLLLLLGASYATATCPEGFECYEVKASGLSFDCHFAGKKGGAGDVMLLHGFPEWSSMYFNVMKELADNGYYSVACDQRGYSPHARPQNETDYNYNLLRDDVFNIAAAVGFSKFHLVAHDHGAVLGWYAAGDPRGKAQFLSYSALSIPHDDAFAAGLQGPNADLGQQMASQYFSMFTLKDSASIHGYAMYLTMGLTDGFSSADDFQKALWWYNGAMAVGVIARPPIMTADFLEKHGQTAMSALRWLYGGTPDNGIDQKVKIGKIETPVLFACGTSDDAILCNQPYALKTADYCDAKTYQHIAVDCGHGLLSCSKSTETQKVMDAIVNRIKTATELAPAPLVV
jgi:pimeloyl-ACP methyl ester carboxylesterase